MNSIKIKPYIPRLYLAVFISFMVNKFVLRPFVLDHELPAFLQIFVLSIPNTFEAIIGMSIVASLLMAAKLYFSPRFDRIPNFALYFLATVLVGTYVLTQEFNLHSLGGKNTFDPYDVVSSIIGIVVMMLLFWLYGIVEHATGSA